MSGICDLHEVPFYELAEADRNGASEAALAQFDRLTADAKSAGLDMVKTTVLVAIGSNVVTAVPVEYGLSGRFS